MGHRQSTIVHRPPPILHRQSTILDALALTSSLRPAWRTLRASADAAARASRDLVHRPDMLPRRPGKADVATRSCYGTRDGTARRGRSDAQVAQRFPPERGPDSYR